MQAIIQAEPLRVVRFFAIKTLQFSYKERKTLDFILCFAMWF